MKFEGQNIILRISDLTISGKNNEKITDGLSFDIERFKITGLSGSSGSGKTLTALSVLGLTRYLRDISISGTILFNDKTGWKDLTSFNEKELTAIRGKKIAYIMQDPLTSFDPNKKCGSQYWEVSGGIRSKEVLNNILQKMNLEKRILDAYPHQLSGGELQRFAIAIAVSSDPDLLIADEPTTNLDANLTKSILELLKEINREKSISILLISHDIKALRSVCDNIAIIHNGKLAEYRTNADFFRNPASEYSKQLTDAFFNFSLPEKPSKEAGKHLNILSLSCISKTFKNSFRIPFITRNKNVNALKCISFNLGPGETLGIIGESGSGKTTIARILVSLNTADDGTIMLCGRNVTRPNGIIKAFIRNRIQIVFQNPVTSLNRIIKVKKLLNEPFEISSYKKNTEKKIDPEKLKEQLGIDNAMIERYPDQVSGGEAQRIALSRALALGPEIIVLDESLSALDRISQNEILKLLNEIQVKYRTSYIFITHDIGLAAIFCDRMLILKQGRIIEQGVAGDIFDHPTDPYTKSLIYGNY
ncbi:MAG: ABC transporter ATP-binding protein [Deltaproteobacteria bacterium]